MAEDKGCVECQAIGQETDDHDVVRICSICGRVICFIHEQYHRIQCVERMGDQLQKSLFPNESDEKQLKLF
jgi:hypothetical protein